MTAFTGSKADVLNSDYDLPISVSLLNLPNYTTAERDAIASSDLRPGLMVFNITLNKAQVLINDESTWETITSV